MRVKAILDLAAVLGAREVWLEVPTGATVATALDLLVQKYGAPLAEKLFEPESRQLRPYIRLVLNNRDLFLPQGLETVLNEQDTLLLLPPAGGG